MENGKAVIEDGHIVIRVAISELQLILEANPVWPDEYVITDVDEAAKSIVDALNEEEEDGTTVIHRAFDEAGVFALEQGYDGFGERDEEE